MLRAENSSLWWAHLDIELEQFSADEWFKLQVEHCSKLIDRFKKNLLAVTVEVESLHTHRLVIKTNFPLHKFLVNKL
jgi:hypothetical protein